MSGAALTRLQAVADRWVLGVGSAPTASRLQDGRAQALSRRRAAVKSHWGSVLGFVLCALLSSVVTACDTPDTSVVLENRYPPSTSTPLVIYQAFWQAVSFTTPIPPGSSSGPESTIAASANAAYVALAPGWNPMNSTPPTFYVVLQSRIGFSVQLNQTLSIAVDDTTFAGNCAAGSFLSQTQADFLTQIVFSSLFAGLSYDAATCTTTANTDAGPN